MFALGAGEFFQKQIYTKTSVQLYKKPNGYLTVMIVNFINCCPAFIS